ncbi:class I SAM-dependent methyltransferase [Oleispirillum naphthae]|uniref:class I SAM-dependent methyltransferase n=1 Tax=Oleispirillum naphthae TaxID=2838853 RepID=UPI0030825226
MSEGMTPNAAAALLTPFSTGLLPFPEGARSLLLRAAADPALAPWRGGLVCAQGFRPAFNALAAAGFDVRPDAPEEGGFATVLCLLSKHKAVALADVARALDLVAEGGLVVCAGAADAGAAAVEKAAARAFGGIGRLSKHHCRVFWLRRNGPLPPLCASWRAAAGARPVAAIEAVSAPGVFGWDRIDPGSRLLAGCLDARISGRVADFGAGWGYLCREMLRRCPGIASLDAVEAEAAALAAARLNLAPPPGVALALRWHDVLAEPGLGPYDWVISNPPFHDGKAGDPEIGRGFIRAARAALAPGGHLLLVANRHLPYESAIDAAFSARAVAAEDSAFKVIEART